MFDSDDYPRRDGSLPPFCKNLTDLWAHDATVEASGKFRERLDKAIWRNETGNIEVGEMHTLIQQLFEFEGCHASVSFQLPDESLWVDYSKHCFEKLIPIAKPFLPSKDPRLGGSVVFREDDARAAHINQFFAAHGMKIPTFGPNPASFVPNAPVSLIYRMDPPILEARQAFEFATELFKEICGLETKSEVQFLLHEMELPDDTSLDTSSG